MVSSTPSNSAMTSSSRAIDLLCRHRRGLVGAQRVNRRLELGLQLPEILDDAVMDDGDVIGHVRVCIGLAGPAMRRRHTHQGVLGPETLEVSRVTVK